MKRAFTYKFAFLLVIIMIFCFSSNVLAKVHKYLSYNEIKEIFLKEVKKRLYYPNAKIVVLRFKLEPDNLLIPKKAVYRIKFFSQPSVGSNCAILTFYENHKKIAILRVWGYVEAEVPVVVAKRNIRCRAIITKEDVALKREPLSRLPQDVIFSLKDAIGKEARVSLKMGSVLRLSYVQAPVIIRRNQEVTIIARGKYVIVRAKGKALENGRLGEIIRVMNVDSKKQIWARVISPEEVEVMF